MPDSMILRVLFVSLLMVWPRSALGAFHEESAPHEMPGMPVEREVTGEHFDLLVVMPQNLPKAGLELVLTFKIRSKTAPHTRLTLAFLVDGREISSLKGVVPPHQTASAEFKWKTRPGRHRLAAQLSSALGVVIAGWETEIEILGGD